jgi:hypothetical protein
VIEPGRPFSFDPEKVWSQLRERFTGVGMIGRVTTRVSVCVSRVSSPRETFGIRPLTRSNGVRASRCLPPGAMGSHRH